MEDPVLEIYTSFRYTYTSVCSRLPSFLHHIRELCSSTYIPTYNPNYFLYAGDDDDDDYSPVK